MKCDQCGAEGTVYDISDEPVSRLMWKLGEDIVCACCYYVSMNDPPPGHIQYEAACAFLTMLGSKELLLVENVGPGGPSVGGDDG